MYMAGDSHKLTDRVTGVAMLELLKEVRQQPASIHDIKMMFHSKNLHEILLQKGCTPNKNNKGIKITFPIPHANIHMKAMVYPNTIQIDIGCTFKPIIYNISGVIHLTSLLGEVRNYLRTITSDKVEIPDVAKWIITHYHFGKDGLQEYSGEKFHMTYEEVSEGTIRFYSKVMTDGKTILRAEQIQTPRTTIDVELVKMIISEERKLGT